MTSISAYIEKLYPAILTCHMSPSKLCYYVTAHGSSWFTPIVTQYPILHAHWLTGLA